MAKSKLERFDEEAQQIVSGGVTSLLETLASLGSGMVAQPVAGIGGLAELPRGSEKAAARVRALQEALTYEPKTDAGRRSVENVTLPFQKLEEHVIGPVSDKAYESAGPAAGAAVYTLLNMAGPKGSPKSARSKQRGAINPNARGSAQNQMLQDAPKEVDVGKRFKSGDKAGIYRGTEAFGGITPSKLGKMRADYLRHVERGAEHGADWYDNASAMIHRKTGQNELRSEKLADALAITSSSTPVGPNLMFAQKGWNQALTGEPVKTGIFPNAMGPRIEKAWKQEDAGAGLGLKRSPYRAGLSVKWRGPEAVERATHDIHDVRAWGITDPNTGGLWSKGVAPAGHRFLDDQTAWAVDEANKRGIGGRKDWLPHRTQAAAWISQKADTTGMPIEKAAHDYSDFSPTYNAQVTREWVPGTNTGHLEGLQDAPLDVRRAFTDDMEQVVTGSQGIDALASSMGALTDPTLRNRGVYEGATNPGFASQIGVGQMTGSNAIDPSSAKVMDAVAAAHGLLGTQKQSAWNFGAAGVPVPQSKAGAFDVRLPTGAMDEGALAELNAVTDRVGGDVPMVEGRGARVLEFSDAGDPARKARVQALRQFASERGGEVVPVERSGNIFPVDENFNAPETYSTLPYIEKIEAGGPQMVEGFDSAMKTMAPDVLARTERFAAQNGFASAPWFKDAMDALATGGLAKLKELQRAGIVPAAFVVGLGAELFGDETGDMQ